MGSRGRGMGAGLRHGPLTTGGRRREGLSPHTREQLAKAHELASSGQHGEAAAAFEHLATRAGERGEHVIAVHLQAEAARALLAGGQVDAAAEAATKAAGHAALAQRPQKSARTLAKVVHALRAGGHEAQADAVEGEARARIGVASLPSADDVQPPTINRQMRRTLPKACPTCGLPTVPERLDVSDDGLADCGWCGATVTA